MTGKVIWHMTMSLDGFVADPNDSLDWTSGGGSGPSALADEVLRDIGAFMCGGRLFTGNVDAVYGGAWTGPVLILTHHPPAGPIDPRVTILSGDIRAAVERGLELAGGKDLIVTGGSVPRQCIGAGLVDEIAVHVVPVLLGAGVRFFDCPGIDPVRLERVHLAESGPETDFRFRVRKTADVIAQLERAYAATGAVIAAIPPAKLDAPSPCKEWTVRVVANHLVGGLDFMARTIEGQPVELPDADAPDPDYLGADPAAAYRAAADRCLAAFRRPGALAREYAFVSGPTTGETIANISLQESLVHGWDLAQGAGLTYTPDPAGVDTVARFNAGATSDDVRREGMFGPAQPAPPDADAFAALLARLGRRP